MPVGYLAEPQGRPCIVYVFMACNTVTDIVVRETGRYLPGAIYDRNFATSPWLSFMKRGVYPGGLSETINVLTYERTAPPSTFNSLWSNVSVVDGSEGGACLPSATRVGIGSTTRNFQIARVAVEGPDFCAEEFRSVFDLRMQLDRITDVLSEYTRLAWEDRDRHEYFRLVANKVSVNGCGPSAANTTTEASAYPAQQPTQTLSLGLLDYWRIRLLRDGAAKSAAFYNNGAPVLTVIASQETIGQLIRDNDDIREDLRWADSGRGDSARLIQAFGINHTYGGFAFFADPYPRRFTYSGGTFTEVSPFTSTAATKGNKAIINTAWEVAPYEESFIFDPEVMHQLIPQPITNPAPMFRFNPVEYTGDWKVMNIPNRECNPDGNLIYHRGILAAASMPVQPQRGVAFVHLRCNPACGALSVCAS